MAGRQRIRRPSREQGHKKLQEKQRQPWQNWNEDFIPDYEGDEDEDESTPPDDSPAEPSEDEDFEGGAGLPDHVPGLDELAEEETEEARRRPPQIALVKLDGHTKVMLQNFRPARHYPIKKLKNRLHLLQELGEQIAEKYPEEIAALDQAIDAPLSVVVINNLRRWIQKQLAKDIEPKSNLELEALTPAISITANRERVELPRGRVLPLSAFIQTADTTSRMSRDQELDLRLLAAYDQAVRAGDEHPELAEIVERFMASDPEFEELGSAARNKMKDSLRQRLGRVLKDMGRR